MGLTYAKTAEGHLRIAADQEMQAELIQMRSENPDEFGTDRNLHEVFEGLIGNSDLTWIWPEMVGALTDAPMLGILEEFTREVDPSDNTVVHAGKWEDPNDEYKIKSWGYAVEEAWAFMDYALRSPLDDLADKGYVIFTSGK
jgi:hypothetical protein